MRDVDLHNQYAVLTVYICLQTTNQYLRDQILYSILWKVRFKLNCMLTLLIIGDIFFFNIHSQKNVQETQTLLKSHSDPDDMLKELQVMFNNNNTFFF